MKLRNKKKILKIITLNFFLFFLCVSISQATEINFVPQVGIPNTEFNTTFTFKGDSGAYYIAKFVQAIYEYGVSVVAILAAIMLMAGGLVWLSSGGNQEKVGKAKNIIFGSLIGMFLLIGAHTILKTINPNLVNLRIPDIKNIDRIDKETYGCCEFRDLGEQKAQSISSRDCKDKKGEFFEPNEKGIYLAQGNQCTLFYVGCNIAIDCDGNVKWCHDSDRKITTRQTCGFEVKTLYEFKDGRCINLDECNGKRVNCFNVADGDKCDADKGLEGWWTRNIFKKSWGYCYDSMCYLGHGLLTERCGSKPGAFCSDITCSNLGQANDKYYRDNSSGRKCSANLYCCYKE